MINNERIHHTTEQGSRPGLRAKRLEKAQLKENAKLRKFGGK